MRGDLIAFRQERQSVQIRIGMKGQPVEMRDIFAGCF